MERARETALPVGRARRQRSRRAAPRATSPTCLRARAPARRAAPKSVRPPRLPSLLPLKSIGNPPPCVSASPCREGPVGRIMAGSSRRITEQTSNKQGDSMSDVRGVPIVLTAPLTESIDHAGFFIQMSLASIPGWMEWVIDKQYPAWRDVPVERDGRAGTAPAGLRVVEAVLVREFGRESVVVCYPDDLPRFLGPETRVVGISTHNPLGTTFAAGVYA